MMKKGIIRIAISSVLVIIMLMQCFPVLALSGADVLSADSSALIKFNIEDVSGKPDDTVEVKISVSGEAEVSGLLLHSLTYDESALEFVEFKSGALVNSSLTKDASINGKTITLGYENNIIPNGEICTAVFSIKSTAEDGKYTIGFSRISASNNGREVSSELTAGIVTVSKWLVGDFDENGIVDMRDAVHFIGWVNFSYIPDLYPMVYDGNKDFNDDGTVDMQDAVYLIGWINFSFTGLYDIDWYGKGKCNHSMQHISAKAATCTEDGNIEYWHCDECGKYFSDAEGKTEITAEETVLAQTGHMEVIDAAVLPTYDSTGLTEGSHCSKCGKILKNQDVIPKLEAIYHSIIYKDTKGAEIPVDKMRYSEHEGLLDLPVISADGYTFKGWYTASEGGTKVDHIIKGSKDDKVLYAHWELVKYTITYKDAPIKNNQTEFTIEDEIVLNDPEWSGLMFVNWTDESGDTVSVIKKGTAKNVTITANWKSYRNNVVPAHNSKMMGAFIEETGLYYFAYKLGTIENVIVSSVVDSYNKTTDAPRALKLGDTINTSESEMSSIATTINHASTSTKSWSETKSWAEVQSKTKNFTNTLTAGVNFGKKDVWNIGISDSAQFGITWGDSSSNGKTTVNGTVDSETTGSSLNTSSTISYSNTMSMSKSSEITVLSEMPNGLYEYVYTTSVTVYGVVIYDSNAGDYCVGTYSTLGDLSTTLMYYKQPSDKDDYPCDELDFDTDKAEEIEGIVKSSYYIRYDANGGAGEMLNTVHKIDKRENLASNKFTREGYVFTGWGLEPDGGALYPDNAEVTNISEKNEAVTLYAIWKPIPYSVNWNDAANCTIVVKRISSQISGVPCGTIAKGAIIYYGDVLSIEYKCNTGYSVLSHGSTSITVSGNITSSEIYATAGANTYTIEYNANGGTGATSSSLHTYGQSEALTSNGFKRHGWTFLGWSTDKNATSAMYTDKQSVINLSSQPNAKVTLYAVWKIKTNYTINYQSFNVGRDDRKGAGINLNEFVDLSSLREYGYTKVTLIQKFNVTKTSNDKNAYVCSQVCFDSSNGVLWRNSPDDVTGGRMYTNIHYFTNGASTAELEWTNTRNLDGYTTIYFTFSSYNPWSIFRGYQCDYSISNYKVEIIFSK